MGDPEEELPAWSMRRDDPRAHSLKPGLPDGIDRDWAWAGSTGRGVSVAVVDSGVDPHHDLVQGVQRAVHVRFDPDGEPEVVEEGIGDRAGHGTACAGIVRSIAPDCELWDVCVLGPHARGNYAALVEGVAWAVEQGARVVNLSLSSSKARAAELLHAVADDAYFRSAVIVASAHNLEVRSYPWRFSSVVSVASHEGEDPLEFLFNPDPPVELFARGMNVEVAWTGGSRITAAGNSFATAHVSGVCALILAKHPELTPFQVKSVLYATASNIGAAA
ncbi:MAG TPA: S8 family serine peptidase [Solirubrobacteraceae bacterium]|nr:S8 family serine peptidase [Solirubrobacteraceae bacterium]